jgi:hypothetical protein
MEFHSAEPLILALLEPRVAVGELAHFVCGVLLLPSKKYEFAIVILKPLFTW